MAKTLLTDIYEISPYVSSELIKGILNILDRECRCYLLEQGRARPIRRGSKEEERTRAALRSLSAVAALPAFSKTVERLAAFGSPSGVK